jgi:N-acetylneuraminic acid mutarotase
LPLSFLGCGKEAPTQADSIGGKAMKLITTILAGFMPLMSSVALLAIQADTPSERIYHTMIYHTKSDNILLYAGFPHHTQYGSLFLNDLWAYSVNANTWQKLGDHPTAPSDAAAYDEESNRMILFDEDGNTWSYALETDDWEKMEPTVAPSGLWGGRMAYDALSDRVILFGGVFLNDTWAYDYNANEWTLMTPQERPSPRAFFDMAYDSESDRIILWGGRPVAHSTDVKVWAYDYDTDTWTSLERTSGPELRFAYHRMVYHPNSDRIIMFGGLQLTGEFTGPLIDQTWSYDFNTNTWTELTPVTSPTARSHHGMACNSSADKIILFGGEVGSAYSDQLSNETWIFDAVTNEWTESTNFEPPGLIPTSQIDHVTGTSSAIINALVVDSTQLTGDLYRVTFNDTLFDFKVYDVLNVDTDEKVLENATQTFNVLSKGPLFDGIRLMIKDFDPVQVDQDSTGWTVGSSTLKATISVIDVFWPPDSVKGIPWPCDYKITLFDHVVDISISAFTASAVPMKFSVRNITEGKPTSIVFFDLDHNNTISMGDKIYILEKNSLDEVQFTWSLIFWAQVNIILPVPGDEFTFRTLKSLTSDDVYEFRTTLPTSVADENYEAIPRDVTLYPNYPNPFNPSTTITYFLSKTEKVRIVVYNLLGQEVCTLVDKKKPAGFHELLWDGKDDYGHRVASGVYLYRLEAKGPSTGSGQSIVQTRKMVLLQ